MAGNPWLICMGMYVEVTVWCSFEDEFSGLTAKTPLLTTPTSRQLTTELFFSANMPTSGAGLEVKRPGGVHFVVDQATARYVVE